jgi:hypothetical protein
MRQIEDGDSRISRRVWITLLVATSVYLSLSFADQISDVEALEAQCEQQRQDLIKPLREMEIAKCKAQPRNDPDFCERYWRDYGSATRQANGTMSPRMFDDLPVCMAAFQARKDLINRKNN